MARGTQAKNEVISKIQTAFGENFIGEYNKKIYVWANDGNDRVQIAIALTCPKEQVGVTNIKADLDFTGNKENQVIAPANFTPAKITKEETDKIADLMAKLNL